MLLRWPTQLRSGAARGAGPARVAWSVAGFAPSVNSAMAPVETCCGQALWGTGRMGWQKQEGRIAPPKAEDEKDGAKRGPALQRPSFPPSGTRWRQTWPRRLLSCSFSFYLLFLPFLFPIFLLSFFLFLSSFFPFISPYPFFCNTLLEICIPELAEVPRCVPAYLTEWGMPVKPVSTSATRS